MAHHFRVSLPAVIIRPSHPGCYAISPGGGGGAGAPRTSLGLAKGGEMFENAWHFFPRFVWIPRDPSPLGRWVSAGAPPPRTSPICPPCECYW